MFASQQMHEHTDATNLEQLEQQGKPIQLPKFPYQQQVLVYRATLENTTHEISTKSG